MVWISFSALPWRGKNLMAARVSMLLQSRVSLYIYIYTYIRKAIPLQPWTGPEFSRRLRLPDLKTIGTWRGKVVSPTHRPPLPHRKYSWYSFLLRAESTPVPQCDRKGYVNEKFQWHNRESNPRPSSLQLSVSTNYAIACPYIYIYIYIYVNTL